MTGHSRTGTSSPTGSPKRRRPRDKKKDDDDDDDDEKRYNWARVFVGIAFLFLLFGGALQTVLSVIDGLYGGYQYIDVKLTSSESIIKEVFFSGDPYLVYCAYAGTAAQSVSPLLISSRHELKAMGVKLSKLDCGAPLPSTNRSLTQRFNLPPHTIAVMVANRQMPVPVPPFATHDKKRLLSFVKREMKPKIDSLTKVEEYPTLCLNAKRCVVYGVRGGGGRALTERLSQLIEVSRHARGVKVLVLDTSKFKVSLDEVLTSVRPDLSHTPPDDRVTVLCLIAPSQTKGNTGTAYGTFYTGSLTDNISLGSFLTQCNTVPVPPPKPFVGLNDTPSVSQRK
eukprot:GHVN01102333.1.p1 GENE.GHVN01102333.1~~GHVN01102333.1.p1  ORF type:complete len:339 (+),score=78.34 GHVN01102333.1:1-1017(+)